MGFLSPAWGLVSYSPIILHFLRSATVSHTVFCHISGEWLRQSRRCLRARGLGQPGLEDVFSVCRNHGINGINGINSFWAIFALQKPWRKWRKWRKFIFGRQRAPEDASGALLLIALYLNCTNLFDVYALL